MNIAWARLIYLGASGVVAGAAAYYGRDWIIGNKEAVNLIATIFSVLAGFLIAVMALVADDRMIATKTARARYMQSQVIRTKLTRHKLLFQLYLVVMLLAFAVTLKLGLPAKIGDAMHCVMLGLATFAFLISFSLPSQITSEYLRKLEEYDKPAGQDKGDS